MTQLYITTGDSPQALLAQMDADLAAARLGPFDDEHIIVQSLGMERWVRQQLARRRGCAASLEMPFPAAFCRRLATSLHRDTRLGGGKGAALDARFEEPALTWRLFALLQDDSLLADEVFAPLRTFFAGADATKRYGLARRVAGRFDEYRLYRPELLLAWEQTPDDHAAHPHARWQGALWRQLLAGESVAHFARWFTHTIARLETIEDAPAGLPARVSVFGISTLPPLFIQLLRAVSRFVPVRFYTLVPSRNGWDKEASTHPLFDAFGHASRELLNLLSAPVAGGVPNIVQHVTDHGSGRGVSESLLHRLQRDLRAGHAHHEPHHLLADDRSLSVHVCHAPMREVEVLRDQLLDAFAADPTLRPHDILVMVPDVETYAPLAEAIFGGVPKADGQDRVAIPYRVADRSLAREAAPARALLQTLDLATARLTSSEVVELLLLPPVRRAAGIGAGQLDRVVGWIQDAGIRWGRDGTARAAQYGLPAIDDNSWRLGLDRLLAGYATGRVESLVGGVLPVSGDLVGDTDLLGAFITWVDTLFDQLTALQTPRSLKEWAAALQVTFRWLVQAEGASELAAADRVLADLTALETATDEVSGESLIPLEVVREWLNGALGSDDHATGFLTGGMTICAMKPMRAIPHRIIAMLGLDDKAFPRRQRREAFDLIGAVGRAGDRDPRADDRQLLLDTVLCAEDRLLLSYVGRSQKDNAVIAPSIVVAELLDHLDVTCQTSSATPRAQLRVEHPLQPFNAAYFAATSPASSRLFSFDEELARSVRAALSRHEAPPFLDTLPPTPALMRDASRPTADVLVVTLNDLMDTWVNPARLYCQRVLQLDLRGEGDVLEDTEPMAVDALLSFRMKQRMLDRTLQGRSDVTVERALATATGELPSGFLGPAWHDETRRALSPMLKAVGTPPFREPLTVDVMGADWHLVGQLDLQLDDEQWRVRAAKLKAADRARAWVAHVARAASGAGGSTRVISTDGELVFEPLPDPLPTLDTLIQAYRHLRTAPLPYFIEAACAYADAVEKNRPTVDAARRAFEAAGDYGGARGDVLDDYVALLWRGRDPLAECWEDFVALADAFWAPMKAATRS